MKSPHFAVLCLAAGLFSGCVPLSMVGTDRGNITFRFEAVDSARALSPKVYDVIDHVHAVMTPNGGSAMEADIQPEISQKSSFSLATDTDWTVEFSAMTASQKVVAVAQLAITSAELSVGGLVKTVALKPTKTGDGTFKVDFWFPANSSIEPDFSVRRFPDTSPTSLTTYSTLSDTGGVYSAWPDQSGHDLVSSSYRYDKLTGKASFSGRLPAGSYQLILSLGSFGNDEVYSGIVNVFDNLETTGLVSNPLFNVEFDSNGGSGTMQKLEIPAYVTAALPMNAFVRNGRAFYGWNLDPAGGSTAYADGGAFVQNSAAQATLYAQWVFTTIEACLSTSLATYSAASVNDLVPITASEYAEIQKSYGVAIQGYTGHIDDVWATGTATTGPTVAYGSDFPATIGGNPSSTVTTLPAGNWVRAVSYIPAINNSGQVTPAPFDFRIKGYNGGSYVNYSNLYSGSIAANAIAGRLYFVIKAPSVPVGVGTTYIAAYASGGSGLGTVTIASSGGFNLYSSPGDPVGVTSQSLNSEVYTQLPTLQVISTAVAP